MSKANADNVAPERSYFEQQRELLVKDIGTGMEQVLQNINKLNRSLEGIVAVGSEFSSVEALWLHFEGVMGKDPGQDQDAQEVAALGEGDDTVVGQAQGQ